MSFDNLLKINLELNKNKISLNFNKIFKKNYYLNTGNNFSENSSIHNIKNFSTFKKFENENSKYNCFKMQGTSKPDESLVKKYILIIKDSSNSLNKIIENPDIFKNELIKNKKTSFQNLNEINDLSQEKISKEENFTKNLWDMSDSYSNHIYARTTRRKDLRLRPPFTTSDRINDEFNLNNFNKRISEINNKSLNFDLSFINKSPRKNNTKRRNNNFLLEKNCTSKDIDSYKNDNGLRSLSSLKNDITEKDKTLRDTKNKLFNVNISNISDINLKLNKYSKSFEKNQEVNSFTKKSSINSGLSFKRKQKIEACDSMEILYSNSSNKITSNSKILPKSSYNSNNKISSISNIVDEIKEFDAILSKKHHNYNINSGISSDNIEYNQNENKFNKNLNSDFFNKLSALLHDFKHIVYDNMIYFDYLILKYIQPIIIAPENQANNILSNTFRYNISEVNKIKDELIYLSVIKDYTISLILNITNFMSDNEFLSGGIEEIVNITDIINLMEKIFNRRLEYENAMTDKIDNTLNNNLNVNTNINSNFISNKKNIVIKSKIRNDDNILDFKIKSNKNLIISLLYNIISNSYKYTDSGSILIEAEFSKKEYVNSILIKISDTGKGIPKEILKNWGKPFNLNDKTVGTGLGQFLINSISKKLRFQILKPEHNKFSSSGTVFKILIPIPKSDLSHRKIKFHNTNENNLKSFDSNLSVKNKACTLQDKKIQKIQESTRKNVLRTHTKISGKKKTIISSNLDTLILTSNLKLNLVTNNDSNDKNLHDSIQNITTEIQNLNFNIDSKLKAFCLFNNINVNEIKSLRSNPDNYSSSYSNTNNKWNSKLFELGSNRESPYDFNWSSKRNFAYYINKNNSENNTPSNCYKNNRRNSKLLNIDLTKSFEKSSCIDFDLIINNNNEKNLVLPKESIELIQYKSNSFTLSERAKIMKEDNEKRELNKTINILCLDDELIFLQGLEKNLRNVAKEFKEYNFNLIFTNCLQDFFKEFMNLLFKNLKVDFFIMDQNISQNMRGIDCCKIANEFYKLYFKDSYFDMNFQFFFITEEVNLMQYKIMKFKRNLICKEHIFGKLQLKNLCDLLFKYIKNS